jgi:rhodanese-related sulfurtransferase
MKNLTPFLAGLLCLGSILSAEEQIGLTTLEAHEQVTTRADEVLFIDVRDPVEIMFTGFTDLVDLNIPFLLVDRSRWNGEKGTFQMDRNPAFVAQVDAALKAKGLGRDATIIAMCRSGSARGLPSAAFLRENGFPNATYVIHGFQGDGVDEGPQKGRRVKNGWVNDGFPWSTKANPEKLFRPQTGNTPNWLVILTSDRAPTQSMALILSRAERQRNTPVRILLCDQAGYLAVKPSSLENNGKPAGEALPRQLLQSILDQGATVQVCGIFLPTSELTREDLLPGVTPAKPDAISDEMGNPDTKVFVF